ncbi:transposase domain-containing protein, partial [Shigella flexneri]
MSGDSGGQSRDYLDPELISRCLAESGTVTLRKRRL